jgi:hypothetical protein
MGLIPYWSIGIVIGDAPPLDAQASSYQEKLGSALKALKSGARRGFSPFSGLIAPFIIAGGL